jgi:hypothetical protein
MWTVALLILMAASVALYESEKERKDMKEQITRLSTPTKFDQLPYSTELLVSKDNNTYELFKQVSMDNDNPCWHSMGVVNQKTLLSEHSLNS